MITSLSKTATIDPRRVCPQEMWICFCQNSCGDYLKLFVLTVRIFFITMAMLGQLLKIFMTTKITTIRNIFIFLAKMSSIILPHIKLSWYIEFLKWTSPWNLNSVVKLVILFHRLKLKTFIPRIYNRSRTPEIYDFEVEGNVK